MDIQAIFFDIDGTLVTRHREWIPSTIEALKKLKAKGIKLFIATGRPYSDVLNFRKELPVPVDAWITLNGQYCITDEGDIIRAYPMADDKAKEVITYLDHMNIGVFIEEDRKTFINKMPDNASEAFRFFAKVLKVKKYHMSRLKKHPVYQIVPYVHTGQVEEERRIFEILNECKGTRWNDESIDILPIDGGKDTGMDALLDYYDIPLSKSLAIGDGDNDVDMLKHAHISVAMGNSPDYLKEIADYVTDDIVNDGLYKAMKHFSLID